ncbi:hypothetical protein V1290_003587 [Bradyrhizobium sp. AZCC 1578]|uniref:hypothetical protein n=1 Tax=Bradyrhizobium sp. AZCC 1578 TaxID=3117027 RepID=UPI002FF2B26F
MCDASHIWLAAAGTRLICQFRSTRIEFEAKANALKGVAITHKVEVHDPHGRPPKDQILVACCSKIADAPPFVLLR